jgi:hypothetical protein
MKIPESISLIALDNEEESLDQLSELSGMELLELQQVADKITELLSIVFYSRELIAEHDRNFEV